MKNIFLIFGYGVPKDILKDENYNLYLKIVFNKIYDIFAKNEIVNPVIIFSGGVTDCRKPYKRNEADEMIKLFDLLRKRQFVKNLTKNWVLIPEKKSISTLENFLFCKKIISKRKINKANIYIFCEQTRERRIKKLSKIIFNKNYKCCIVTVDFDTSSNRYLDPEFITKKEKEELKHSLWALKGRENLKKHRKSVEEKLKFLREVKSKDHEKEIKKFWEMRLGKL
ncbi:MAG: hypothetical protein U9P70_01210 [Patescibacteria group bacterium]|nr:hypothetical protein [Patescibacteria group bacterium]